MQSQYIPNDPSMVYIDRLEEIGSKIREDSLMTKVKVGETHRGNDTMNSSRTERNLVREDSVVKRDKFEITSSKASLQMLRPAVFSHLDTKKTCALNNGNRVLYGDKNKNKNNIYS